MSFRHIKFPQISISWYLIDGGTISFLVFILMIISHLIAKICAISNSCYQVHKKIVIARNVVILNTADNQIDRVELLSKSI